MYSPFAFLAMYDPAGPQAARASKKDPFGGQEDARIASAAAQEARVHIRVPANTTLFGVAATPRSSAPGSTSRPASRAATSR